MGHAHRCGHRCGSRGTGGVHADGGLPSRLPRVRSEAETGIRRQLTRMGTHTHLEWPFFTPEHRELSTRLDAWAAQHLTNRMGAEDRDSIDNACRGLVRDLGRAGWTLYSVPREIADSRIQTHSFDVRSLALIRETLARYDALADFVFAMQGLGSGAISLAGSLQIQKPYLPPL